MDSRLSLYLRPTYRRLDLGPIGNLAESPWTTNVLKAIEEQKRYLWKMVLLIEGERFL